MHYKPSTVLFILLFAFPFIYAIEDQYDNSQNIGDSQLKTNVTACVFEITEHFVLQKDDSSARMHISSSDIFQSILGQLDFLAQIQPNIIIQEDGQWVTTDTFSNIFRYTQLINSAETLDVNLCNPFLFIRSENSSVCKHGSEIRFSNEACSTMVNQMIRFHDWPNSSFLASISKLPLRKVFTFVENADEFVAFPNVNSETELCKAIIDPDFKSTLQNIYVSSAIMFSNYEDLLTTFFPEPSCQKLTFNMPTSIQLGLPLYVKFPRILAMFINKHLKLKSACIMFGNDAIAPVLPDIFIPTLKLFNQIFLSVQPAPPKKRVKRGSFNRFFEYVFGDADNRLRTLESYTRQEIQMVNFLIDKANATDLVIKHDEKILSHLFEDIKVEQFRLIDLTLKLDLQRLSRNFHAQFQLSLSRLQNFHTIYQNILLEFKTAFEHDLLQLSKCVQGKPFCFHQHKQLHCTKNCFLTVQSNFFINFHLLSYKKLRVFHAQCLHTLAGQISLLNNGMFLKNSSHFSSIDEDLFVPLQCAQQTQENNIKCKPYFKNIKISHIMQCRNNKIVATGNDSYTNPKLEEKSLSYVPQIISSSDFPIRIKNKQVFADEICGQSNEFLSIPRKKFNTFYTKSPTFLFNIDPAHNVSFQTNFIHTTLKKIQRVKARQIFEVAQSTTFLLSCILAIIIFISLLSCCFCPILFVNMLKCILTSLIQFFTYLVERFVHLMTIFVNMLCTIYAQNQSNDQHSSETPTPAVMQQQLPEAQQMLEDQNEIQNVIPFSPISTSTIVSLAPANVSPPNIQSESAARKALRFMNLPVKARRFEAGAQRLEPDAQSVPTAPSPTFIYRDMPGTPRRLF